MLMSVTNRTAAKAAPLSLTRSAALRSRASDLIPVGAQTFSKAPPYFVEGVYPVFLQRGEGAWVWDVDGNRYIDYVLGLGAITLGYGHPEVNASIVRQLEKGISFSLPHPLEIEVAELLRQTVPCAEMARFSKTGSEVTSAAIRAARAYTGRDHIAYASYHGWHDWYAVTTSRNKGIPRVLREYVHPFTYNDIRSLEAVFSRLDGSVAAVIMEPVVMEEPHPGYLEEVKELAHRHGALLIFDEIVTGFRWAPGGAQAYYGVTPDLATFGKGMANGMPLSAVVGRRDVMACFEEVFFSTTFGGEALSLAAAAATIRTVQRENVCQHLWEAGARLQAGFNRIAAHLSWNGPHPLAECVGPAVRPKLVFRNLEGKESPLVKSLFMQEMVRRGVLLHSGALNLCLAHTCEVVDATLNACEEALRVVLQAVVRGTVEAELDGLPYREVFRRV